MTNEPTGLPGAPLVLAVLEVKYPELPSRPGGAAELGLREALHDVLPLAESTVQDLFAVGPDGPKFSPRSNVLRFTTRDRTTALAVTPGGAVLETTSYTGFTRFLELASTSMAAIESFLAPDGILRVGLRYIDEIRVDSVDSLPGDWSGYIDNHLLATAQPEFLEKTGLQPKGWQGLVQYSTGPDQLLQLRYGPQDGYAVDPNGPTRRKSPVQPGPFFLLDSDSWWEPTDEVPSFTAVDIDQVCRRLHTPLRHIFNVVSLPKLVAIYKGA